MFYVERRLDLNEFPYLKDPVKVNAQKAFGCFCFKSDPLEIFLSLPKTGFIPGQFISVSAEVLNNSDMQIDSIYILLEERMTWIAKEPNLRIKEKINVVKDQLISQPCDPLTSRAFKADLFIDPNYKWKMFYGCEIIKCVYVVTCRATAKGFHRFVDKSIPITIGTKDFIEHVDAISENEVIPEIKSPSTPPFQISLPLTDNVICEQPLPTPGDGYSMSSNIGWSVAVSPTSENDGEEACKYIENQLYYSKKVL